MNFLPYKFIVLTVTTLLCLFANHAHAASRITSITDVAYRGSLEYKNAGYTLAYAQSHEQKLKKIIENAREVTGFEDEVRQLLLAELSAAFDDIGISSIDRFEFDIAGPIVIELIGKPDGTVTAKVGGFSISLHANGDNSYFEVDATASSNTLWLSGDYDIVTGNITNLSANGFNVTVDVDLDVAVWVYFVPIVGELVLLFDNKIEQVVAADAERIVELAVSIFESDDNTVTLFGLDQAIPVGEFVLGNFDAGQELIDLVSSQFTSLVSGESFRLEIEKSARHYNLVAPAWPSNENPAYTTVPSVYNQHRVSINFSDHLFLNVSDIPEFEFRYSNCSWVYCYGAPGGVPSPVDLANTPENPTDITIDHPNGDTIVIPYGLDFDIESLQALFDANPPESTGGVVMASGGTFGWGTNPDCIWVGVSGGADLKCFGALVAKQRTYSGSYGSSSYTVITLWDSTSYEMALAGGYPNFKITTK